MLVAGAVKEKVISARRRNQHGRRVRSQKLPSLARACPQFRLNLCLRPLRYPISICILTQHCERCRPRTRHQRRTNFRLLEQPHLQLREKNKLFKDRTLEVVTESLAHEFLSSVRDAWNFSRASPVHECPSARRAELRFQQ